MSEKATAALRGRFRYGTVLLLAVAGLVFQLLAPDAHWSRAVAIAIGGGALLVVLVTSAAPESARRQGTVVLAVALLAACALVAAGAVPEAVGQIVLGLLVGAVPVALAHGLISLLRRQGVTLQAVAAALAIYVYVGTAFAATISALALLGDAAYFTDGSDGTAAERTYFSFTTLTTTGFGDLAAATTAGRAVAVVEMLVGQLYLVTVIGILVGNLGRRGGSRGGADLGDSAHPQRDPGGTS